MTSEGLLSYKQAALRVLQIANEPLHYADITQRAINESLIEPTGRTPDATMNARLAVDVSRNGESSVFVRVQPGVFALRVWVAKGQIRPMKEVEG